MTVDGGVRYNQADPMIIIAAMLSNHLMVMTTVAIMCLTLDPADAHALHEV